MRIKIHSRDNIYLQNLKALRINLKLLNRIHDICYLKQAKTKSKFIKKTLPTRKNISDMFFNFLIYYQVEWYS